MVSVSGQCGKIKRLREWRAEGGRKKERGG